MHVGYLGVVPFARPLPERAATPRLLYLGRLKRYKRIELLLDVVEAIPDAVLDIAGEGDHRPALEAEIAARGLGDRVVLHGHVSEDEKADAVRAGVGQPDRVLGRGLVPDRDGGRDLRHAERGAADRRAAGVDRRRRDRPAGRRRAGPDRRRAARWSPTPSCASAWARPRASARRASPGSAPRASRSSCCEADRCGARRCACARSLARSETLKAVGMAAATMANNALALIFTVLFARLLGRRGLRLAGRAGVDVRDPRRARLGRCRSPSRARSRSGGSARGRGWRRR